MKSICFIYPEPEDTLDNIFRAFTFWLWPVTEVRCRIFHCGVMLHSASFGFWTVSDFQIRDVQPECISGAHELLAAWAILSHHLLSSFQPISKPISSELHTLLLGYPCSNESNHSNSLTHQFFKTSTSTWEHENNNFRKFHCKKTITWTQRFENSMPIKDLFIWIPVQQSVYG